MNLEHVMIDLETFGVGDHAAIIQIAAVRFDPFDNLLGLDSGSISSPEGTFTRWIDLRGTPGPERGEIELDTLLWWLSQSKDAQQRVFEPFEEGKRVPLRAALVDLKDWAHDPELPEVKHIWANGPQFDLRLLRQACERTGVEWPFSYKLERDFRTLRKVAQLAGIEDPPRVGCEHDARDDAFNQAGLVIKALRTFTPAKPAEGA